MPHDLLVQMAYNGLRHWWKKLVLISPEAHWFCGILPMRKKINHLPKEEDILMEKEALFDGLIDKEGLSLNDLDRLVDRLVEKDVLNVWLWEIELKDDVTVGDVEMLGDSLVEAL